MRNTSGLLVLMFALGCGVCACAHQGLCPAQARDHVGQPAMARGIVVAVYIPARIKGKPTLVNLAKPRPSQILAILGWRSECAKIGMIRGHKYSDKKACVIGR